MTIGQDTPERDTIREKVVDLVAAMMIDTERTELSGSDSLIGDLGFDSVRLIELTMVLERAFGLPPQQPRQLVGVTTVDDVVALVSAHGDDDR